MNKDLIEKVIKEKRDLLSKLEARAGEATGEDLDAIKKQVDTITEDVAGLNKIISGDGSQEPSPEDSAASQDAGSAGSAAGSDDSAAGSSDGSEGSQAARSASTEDVEARAAIAGAIRKGLGGMESKANDERKEQRSGLLFTRMLVGQSVDQEEARSLGIVNGNGAVTIPKTVEKQILSYDQEENGLRQFGSVHQDSTTEGYPVLVKAPTAYGHKDERTTANPIPDSDLQLDEVLLTPTEFDALVMFSKKLKYRSQNNIEQEVTTELAKAYTAKEAEYMFTGKDAANPNTGSLLNKAVAYKPKTAIDWTKGPDTHDALITFKNSVKKEVRKNGMFMINTAAQTVIETMKDANGRPLFNPDVAAAESQFGKGVDGKLVGFNVHVSDYLFADDKMDESVPAIYFGDFSSFNIQDVLGSMEVQILNELYATSNLIGTRIYNLLDGQLIYSPMQPTVYNFQNVATA